MSERPILALGGYAGAGKDAVAKVLMERHGFIRVAFADAIKATALAINPVIALDPESKGTFSFVHDYLPLREVVAAVGPELAKSIPGVREFYQALGVAVRDNAHAEVWVEAAMALVDRICEPVAITDTRFPNEVCAVRDRSGEYVRVVRPGVLAVNAHISERAIDHIIEDYTLRNDEPLDGLPTKVQAMLAHFGID